MPPKYITKTYDTVRDGKWVWKSVSWHIYGPWAEDVANFLEGHGIHVMIKEKRVVKGGKEYHVFVPEHELSPIPGLLAKFSAK